MREAMVTEECFDARRLDDLLLPVLERHAREPGQLVQILREAQELIGKITLSVSLVAGAMTAVGLLRLLRPRTELVRVVRVATETCCGAFVVVWYEPAPALKLYSPAALS